MRKLIEFGLLPTLGLGAGLLLAMPAAMAAPGALTVELEGLHSQKGQVCLSVFNSSRGFPAQGANALKSQCAEINEGVVRVTFEGLRSGSYAVAVLHDENADNQANRNRFGIPTEGFGFSRNPTILTGAPKFADAAFLAVGAQTTIQIKMTYLF
jgi:uncharacterized protein (DUF2141 family)